MVGDMPHVGLHSKLLRLRLVVWENYRWLPNLSL
jgi:hypothetical protein